MTNYEDCDVISAKLFCAILAWFGGFSQVTNKITYVKLSYYCESKGLLIDIANNLSVYAP